ncbi:MAG TPA: tripartite tricarboxylate transporter TctB family protein [Burkholderiales bacterium]|nr:tripartite tricarboxylate transporter TctB family protein [Burkholderiales bacterium]
MRWRSPDCWSGLALAALGGYIVFAASGWDYLTPDGPGPGFFPRWYGVAILALSLVLVVVSGRSQVVDWRGTGRALATWAAFAASLALMKAVGFALGFAALTYFIVAIMYRRRPLLAAVTAAVLAGAFYLLFPFALGVALP